MNEADKLIKYKEDMIKNIKIALDFALQKTNEIELGDKEMSFIIYCDNRDRVVRSAKNDIALKDFF
jgi:hypothetical protein